MELRVEAVQPKGKGKIAVRLDDGTEFTLYQKEIRALGLAEGSVLTRAAYRAILEEILNGRAVRRALYLLERQERTERQLRVKLRQSGYPDESVEAAVAYVKRYHYIDDLRYASNYVRLHGADRGERRLMAELLARGISKQCAEAALADGYGEEYFAESGREYMGADRADERGKILVLLQKRHYSFDGANERERRRTYQFLLRRGFRGADILGAMRLAETERGLE